MYLQEIIEVAIGMLFVWLLISLWVMSILEWIASTLSWRANDLEAALRRMLDNPDFAPRDVNFRDFFTGKKKNPARLEQTDNPPTIYLNNLHWKLDQPIWNHYEDTAILKDKDGHEIHTFDYRCLLIPEKWAAMEQFSSECARFSSVSVY